jgi:hypothetical protein
MKAFGGAEVEDCVKLGKERIHYRTNSGEKSDFLAQSKRILCSIRGSVAAIIPSFGCSARVWDNHFVGFL